jgi:tRNA-dihydrouridine synthase 1
MLVRKYGCNLCYTPMLHSKMMTTQKNYKDIHFTTCEGDRPLVAQLCGDDPEIMVKAAKML